MPSLESIVVLLWLFSIYTVIVIFNYIRLFAYFQRLRLKECTDLHWRHVTLSLLYSILGPLVFIPILKASRKTGTGTKWWKGERASDNSRDDDWHDRWRNTVLRAKIAAEKLQEAGGQCEDLWEM